MANWTSPREILRDQIVLQKLANALAGMYFWEIITSLRFDSDFVARKRQFQWQLVPYFISRYSLLVSLLCLVIVHNSTRVIDCTIIYAVAFFTELSVMCASITFVIRTIAIWSHPFVNLGLWSAILVYSILLGWNTSRSASYRLPTGGCVYVDPAGSYIAVMIVRIYTTSLDALILGLAAYRLGALSQYKRHGKFVQLLLEQGLIYFIVAFLFNTLAVVFLIWRPNDIIGIAGTTPASVITVVAACRAVRSLTDFMAEEIQEQFQTPTCATGTLDFMDSMHSQDQRDQNSISSAISPNRNISQHSR